MKKLFALILAFVLLTPLCACGGLKTKDLAGKYSVDSDQKQWASMIENNKKMAALYSEDEYPPSAFEYTFEIDQNGVGRLIPGSYWKEHDSSNTLRDTYYYFDTKEMMVFSETGKELGVGDKFTYDNGKITFPNMDGYFYLTRISD